MSQVNKVLGSGRGRGRLIPKEVLETPLRKPGMAPATENKYLADKIARLDILFTGPLEDLVVYRILDIFLFREGCTDHDLEKMLEHIFKHILTDASNANHICKYLHIMFRHNEKGSKLRSLFYQNLEQKFIESNDIKLNVGSVQFRNFVKFFAAATHHARNVNYAPFDELIDGLMSLALNLFPSSLQEDIQVFSLCVIRYSQYLMLSNSDGSAVSNLAERQNRLKNAINMARKMYLNNEITKKSLAWLSLVVECQSITDDLLDQYSPPLDKNSLNILKSVNLRIRLPKSDYSKFCLNDLTEIIDFV